MQHADMAYGHSAIRHFSDALAKHVGTTEVLHLTYLGELRADVQEICIRVDPHTVLRIYRSRRAAGKQRMGYSDDSRFGPSPCSQHEH
jgi:hypothetical protein